MPSREALRRYLQEAQGRVSKRDIARAFGLHGQQRRELRLLLQELAAEGVIVPAGRKRFRAGIRLPETMVVQIIDTDAEGDALARPLIWRESAPPPLIVMAAEPRGRPALAPGERVLVRLRPLGRNRYEGRTLRRLTDAPGRFVGLFYIPADVHRYTVAGRIRPTERRARAEWDVPLGDSADAQDGEVVLASPLPQRDFGRKPARVLERLGRLEDPGTLSLISLYEHHLPHGFAPEALAEAAKTAEVSAEGREDLRALPLVTIDGEDARDFDDAVFAEPHGAGWRIVVTIADVAHYVRPGSALDRAARERGNSVYFPDRVVPMLPERLSNHWCSLLPGEVRGCLFVEILIDAKGRKQSHRFGRGIMRSAARLTYEEVEEAAARGGDHRLPDGLLAHLYGAYHALAKARQARGTLDLDIPEQTVVLEKGGKVREIKLRQRLDSHRLIEEFMILANVAAAEELTRRQIPGIYRVHAPPSPEKLRGLRELLGNFDIPLPPSNRILPAHLQAALESVAGRPEAPLVNEMVLRAQSQAEYTCENIGHFGLALPVYTHFTSPIRRYADLLVHRALIAALKLGEPGLAVEDAASLTAAAAHITATERRAAIAERDALDRYIAAYMAERIGMHFNARISGVTRFGLFVTLENGASGIVPLSLLTDDFWNYNDTAQTLSGRKSGRVFRLAETVEVRLAEAYPLTGGLRFHLLEQAQPKRPHRRKRGER
jgi:ribonuclease R